MGISQNKYKLMENRRLNDSTVSITVNAPEIASAACAGQFVNIRAEGFYLRRPISLCGIDRDNKTIRLVIEVRGDGTEAISRKSRGDELDLFGPLGKGFELLPPDRKALLIGGGIGTPPLLPLAEHYKKNAECVLGYRTGQAVILAEDFEKHSPSVHICTDDGSIGIKGNVIPSAEKILMEGRTDIIYACGPLPMLKEIALLSKKYGIRAQISMEERMACGMGACLGCACKTGTGGNEHYKHVCKDGPVFEADELVF